MVERTIRVIGITIALVCVVIYAFNAWLEKELSEMGEDFLYEDDYVQSMFDDYDHRPEI
jgi:hypothetical protein